MWMRKWLILHFHALFVGFLISILAIFFDKFEGVDLGGIFEQYVFYAIPIFLVFSLLSFGIDKLGEKYIQSKHGKWIFSLCIHVVIGLPLSLYAASAGFGKGAWMILGLILLYWLFNFFLPQFQLSQAVKTHYWHLWVVTLLVAVEIYVIDIFLLQYQVYTNSYEMIVSIAYAFLFLLIFITPFAWGIEMVTQKLSPLLHYLISLLIYFVIGFGVLYYFIQDLKFAALLVALYWITVRILPKEIIWKNVFKDKSYQTLSS